MRKTVAWSLILTGCLSGCDVASVISKPPAERVTASGLKSSTGKVQKLTPKAKPTENEAPAPAAGNASKAPETDFTEQATASAPSETATATEATAGRTTLKLVETASTEIGMIPVLADDGSVTSLLFLNDRSAVSWTVEATQGPSALTVNNVKLSLTPESWYPIPADPFASEAATASEAEEATEATEATEIEGTDPPTVVEVQPMDLGWAATIAAGATLKLTYETDSSEIRAFLEKHEGVSRFSLTLTLMDSTGEPLVDGEEKPVVLKQSVQVL